MTISASAADERKDKMEVDYCAVCDGVGHSAGEFGELCPANGPGWLEPSDPRDLDDQYEDSGAHTSEVWW